MLGALWMLLSEYLPFFACFFRIFISRIPMDFLGSGKNFPSKSGIFSKKNLREIEKKSFFRIFLFFINYMYKSSSTPDTVVLRHCVVRLPSQFMIFLLREPFFWVASQLYAPRYIFFSPKAKIFILARDIYAPRYILFFSPKAKKI